MSDSSCSSRDCAASSVVIVTAERKPRIAAWAEFAGTFTRTHPAFLEHEHAKAELKSLMPEDARQAIGHGVRAKRSKSGGITLELLRAEDGDAAI
jgi:hypothetical protein